MTSLLSVALAVTALLVSARAVGILSWRSGTRELRSRLEAAISRPVVRSVQLDQLDDLPLPVRRYLRTVLREGQPIPSTVRFRHEGTFNMDQSGERWRQFSSDQVVTVHPPGFDWDGRIAMLPGLPVHVHDAYVAGEGRLVASLAGLIPLARLADRDTVAAGELMRYLAEAVWYPAALLPDQGVRWIPKDARSATAELTDGPLTVRLTFGFSETGLVETVRSEARGRMTAGGFVPTPWMGWFRDYRATPLGLVPFEGKVAWITSVGSRPYWRGRLREITAD